MKMSLRKQLLLSGWAALLVNIVGIPLTIFFSIFALQKHTETIFPHIISLITFPVSVLVLLTLKKYLNTKHHFKRADIIVIIAVIFLFLENIISTTIFISHISGLGRLAIDILISLIDGVIGLILSLKLLNLKKNIIKSYTTACYLLLIGNILQLTVILSPIGILFSLISNFFFSAFLIKTGRRLK